MKIGMVCYASVGGSGVVATELAHALAERGHRVHLMSSEPPFRLRDGVPGLSFEPVLVPSYPLFREPQYLLALANTIARIAEHHRLDIVHAHYAVPHATAAYLADQMLASTPSVTAPRTVTTLHGTDITLVGSDPSYARVVAFSIERSHAVTAVSESLRADTIATLGVRHPIAVIPNFLDCSVYRRRFDPALRARLAPADTEALLIHVSNFRPVKRVDLAIDAFRLIRRPHPRAARADRRRTGACRHRAPGGRGRPGGARRVPGRAAGPGAVAVGLRSLPAAVGAGELRPGRARSDGLRGAGRRLSRRRPARDHRGRHDRVRLHAAVRAGDGRARDRAAHRPQRRTDMGKAAADVVRTRYCSERIVPLYEAAYRDVLRG